MPVRDGRRHHILPVWGVYCGGRRTIPQDESEYDIWDTLVTLVEHLYHLVPFL